VGPAVQGNESRDEGLHQDQIIDNRRQPHRHEKIRDPIGVVPRRSGNGVRPFGQQGHAPEGDIVIFVAPIPLIEEREQAPQVSFDLSKNKQINELVVKPHALGNYDVLHQSYEEEE
jgi:hypothetical protein